MFDQKMKGVADPFRVDPPSFKSQKFKLPIVNADDTLDTIDVALSEERKMCPLAKECIVYAFGHCEGRMKNYKAEGHGEK